MKFTWFWRQRSVQWYDYEMRYTDVGRRVENWFNDGLVRHYYDYKRVVQIPVPTKLNVKTEENILRIILETAKNISRYLNDNITSGYNMMYTIHDFSNLKTNCVWRSWPWNKYKLFTGPKNGKTISLSSRICKQTRHFRWNKLRCRLVFLIRFQLE